MLLKAQEEKLRQQNVQLDAALNNMVQGLAMFDAEQRLVICNKRYAEMYGLTPEQVKPGTTLREIIEHRIANGDFRGKSADELLRDDAASASPARSRPSTPTSSSDGRYIAVSTQPMADGGTVTTHQDITEQRRSEAKIAHMALHDALTGLPNRVLLNERLEHALARVKRGEIVATHLLDLDHFKTRQRHAGPSRRRQAAADGGRPAARAGAGDRHDRAHGRRRVRHRAGRHRRSRPMPPRWRSASSRPSASPTMIDGHQVVIGTSVGIAVGPPDGATPDQLMRNADLALYRAKGDGRGTFRFFEPEMDAQMQARRAMEYDLRKALAAGEFELHYQPVVNLASNEISGFEALIRWHHPEKGMVSPGTFIPLAEEIGFIVPLGEWAIRRGLRRRPRNGRSDLKVAVNLSPAQFRSPGLVQVVVERAGRLGPGAGAARARDHRDHPAAGQRGDARHALSSCASSACASPWTTSARAIPRSATCRASPSTRSRSTARS